MRLGRRGKGAQQGPAAEADATEEPLRASEPAETPDAASPEPVPVPDDTIAALVHRLESVELTLTKVLAEAKQTGDFVNRMAPTMGAGVDAIRSEARSEAREALMRGHGAVALARLRAEAEGDQALAAVLSGIEADFDAELHYFDITPIIPTVGGPVDPREMTTRGAIPEGVDPSTARPVVETVTACGYRLPDRRLQAAVTVRWEPAGEGLPEPANAQENH